MQVFNKESTKKTFAHTWYIYPLLAGLITVIWLWGFNAFHQPSKHQMLTMFFATDITNLSFKKEIQDKYNREDLRQVDIFYMYPEQESVDYKRKWNLYATEGDLMVMDQNTLDSISSVYKQYYFADITNEVKEQYLPGEHVYYTYVDADANEHTLGVRLKKEGVETYLNNFMTFDETVDYFIVLCSGSVNLGILNGESNAPYDNALTFMKYLIELA